MSVRSDSVRMHKFIDHSRGIRLREDSCMQCLMKEHYFFTRLSNSLESFLSFGGRRLDRRETRVQISDTIIIKIVFMTGALFGFLIGVA